MSMIETEETNQFTFEAFASHNFYTEVNRSLVRHALASIAPRPPNIPLTIVDMACGTGAVTRLIAEELANKERQAFIVGIDPSAEALRRAEKGMKEMQAKGINANVDFIQGEASDLPHILQNADAAFFCNAIHLLPDKLSAFRLIASILAPDGIFACNSAFYNGAYVEGTERFYRLWTRRAVGWLRKEHPEAHLSRETKAIAMQQLDRAGYICLLKEGGFCRVDAVEEQAMMTIDSYRDIGQYWLFIEGALPGIPLTIGAEALGTSVYQAGDELGLKGIPRNWLQIIAHKCN
jgi:ubiquinone/menaquinone biosynthesis C-methylase UbiE